MQRRSLKRALPLALSLAIVGGGALMFGSTPAEARDRDRGPAYRHGNHPVDVIPAGRHYRNRRARHFRVPQVIHHRSHFNEFFLGKFQTRRFGRVAIFEFPVWRHGRQVLVPHAYKRGQLVASGNWMYDRVIYPAAWRDRGPRYGHDYRVRDGVVIDGRRGRRGASVRVGRDWNGDPDVRVVLRGPRFRFVFDD